MTISTTASATTNAGNGATTSFNYSFIAAAPANIVVTYTDANSNETVLAQGSQYTLTMNAAAAGQIWGVGGTVTYPLSGSPIAAGTYLTIQRVIPFTQLTTISNQGDFYPQAVERAMDTLEMQIQQVEFQAQRAIVVNPADVSLPAPLPVAAARAGQWLGFDSLGNPIVGIPVAGAIVSTPMQPFVSAASLQAAADYLFAHTAITQDATGLFYENGGATVNRFNDRSMFGGATVNDCNAPNIIQDWLTQEPGLGWPVFTAQMAVLSVTGQMGGVFASRTSDPTPAEDAGDACIGVGAWVINDYSSTTVTKDAWAMYVEGRHAQLNGGNTWGIELDILAYGGHLAPATPYTDYVPYGAIGLGIASGAGQSFANDATVALHIANNGAKFLTGIKIDANALTGADGTASGGSAEAIAMARGHCINWYRPDGIKVALIESLATNSSGLQALTFTDSGFSYASEGQSVAGFATSTPTLGFTNFSILINNTTSGVVFQQVFLGPANSGGTGNRSLVVPN